jgi:hypothetical protein
MNYHVAPVTGAVNLDMPTGLFYVGPLDRGKQLVRDRAWKVTYNAGPETYLVEIAYGLELHGHDDVAEWGKGRTEEEAWRYALGAATGSYEDPVMGVD